MDSELLVGYMYTKKNLLLLGSLEVHIPAYPDLLSDSPFVVFPKQ